MKEMIWVFLLVWAFCAATVLGIAVLSVWVVDQVTR